MSENTELILENTVVRDLGVQMCPNLNYNEQISKIYSKTSQRAGLLLRTFKNRTFEHMKFLWKTYLQPLIDYGSQIYCPISGGNLYRIESLLESFSAKIEGLKNYHYWERLQKLKLYSISRRYERYRILYCFKILQGKVQNCGLIWQNNPIYGLIFELPKFKKYFTAERRQSFAYNGPFLFNSLPEKIRKLYTLPMDKIKIELDLFLQTIPDNPVTLKCNTGLYENFRNKTNSISRWIPHLGLSARRRELPLNDDSNSML